ncbi:MAG: hypothetical protein IIW18_05570 [Oscillospiraceae bacterium]|nr:hypothetical protein [Oscillospiraceae bacterium]
MNKKNRRINLVQNCLIVALSISAVFLFTRTSLFSELARTELAQRVQTTLSPVGSNSAGENVALSSLSMPLRMALTSDFACYGADALTGSSETFEAVGSFLAEAIGSSHDMETVSEADFFAALGRSGLYFDFPGEMPLEYLAARLGTVYTGAQAPDIRRCLLSVGSGDNALFYLYTQSGVCMRYQTAVSSAALKAYLDTVGGNDSSFAALLREDYVNLSPFTLVLGETAPRSELISANALHDFSTEELLRRTEFNAHTQNSYTESNGTVVILEAQRTLRLEPRGLVLYSGEQTEEPGSLYHVSSAAGTPPTRLEVIGAAQNLLGSILMEKTAEARIYLHSAEPTLTGYRLYFDYVVNGTPVLFSDKSHAAEVLVEGNTITAFSLQLRRYTASDRDCLLLPLRQAAAIGSLYPQSELTVAYIDTFSDVTHAEWVCD